MSLTCLTIVPPACPALHCGQLPGAPPLTINGRPTWNSWLHLKPAPPSSGPKKLLTMPPKGKATGKTKAPESECGRFPFGLARHPSLPSSLQSQSFPANSPSFFHSFQTIPTTTHHHHHHQHPHHHHPLSNRPRHHHQPPRRRNRPRPHPLPTRRRPPLRNAPLPAQNPLRARAAGPNRVARAPHRLPPRPPARPLRVVVDCHLGGRRGLATRVWRRQPHAQGGLARRE